MRGSKAGADFWINSLAYVEGWICEPCKDKHGTIYPIDEWLMVDVKEHPTCRCYLEVMRALVAGTATHFGKEGVDFYLKWYGKWPGHYITKREALMLGWRSKKGNLADVAPGKLIKDVYQNYDGKLPQTQYRVWQEADFDYVSGRRNKCRVLFSNDGLIFVSYDHCKTFVEIK